ncbi:MAG: antibiotic biosynthesis monooxygenase [Pseudomonadales bacterium]|nr:antibiotic biosynthesis monooxygenase [Pseudomonadales bacterium]
MVIVLGSVEIDENSLEQALELSQAHVNRSRQEPGCLSHGVHIDGEHGNRLVFIEQWQDMDALQQHFRVPESGEFVRELGKYATSDPELKIYNASEVPRH